MKGEFSLTLIMIAKVIGLPVLLAVELGKYAHRVFFAEFFYETKIFYIEEGRAFSILLIVWLLGPTILRVYKIIGHLLCKLIGSNKC